MEDENPGSQTTSGPTKKSGSAVDHAIELLKILSRGKSPLGVNEISRQISLHKSTVSRTLRTLESHGIVEREPESGRFRLGVGLMTLAAPLFESTDVVRISRPILKVLAEKSAETVSLYMWDGEMAISVDQELGDQAIQHFAPPGRRNPAHATAAGKAFLAAFDDSILEQTIEAGLNAYTAKTITDPNTFRMDIHRARETGYAVNHEEFAKDVSAVGAPVFDIQKRVVAAIAITVPSFRFGEDKEAELGRLVIAAAHDISRRLGYIAP